jgi:hypothetical protein
MLAAKKRLSELGRQKAEAEADELSLYSASSSVRVPFEPHTRPVLAAFLSESNAELCASLQASGPIGENSDALWHPLEFIGERSSDGDELAECTLEIKSN